MEPVYTGHPWDTTGWLLIHSIVVTAFIYALRYKRDVNGALQFFNLARKDVDWGEKALFHMIAICLNPDNELIAGDTLKSEDQSRSVIAQQIHPSHFKQSKS